MAPIDRDRQFYGTIRRGFDVNGLPVIRRWIEVLDGSVMAHGRSSG